MQYYTEPFGLLDFKQKKTPYPATERFPVHYTRLANRVGKELI